MKCGSCNLKCHDRNALICDKCDKYVHYTCAGLPTYVIVFHELNDDAVYHCKSCTQTLPDYLPTLKKVEKEMLKKPEQQDDYSQIAVSDNEEDLSEISNSSSPTGISIPTPNSQIENESITIERRLKNIEKKSSQTEEKRKQVCHFYRQRKCRHGQKGVGCAFAHPVPCKNHTSPNNKGCRNAEKCKFWHPRICKFGDECRNGRCNRYHLSTKNDPKNLGLPAGLAYQSIRRPPYLNKQNKQDQGQLITLLTGMLSLINQK